MFSPNIAIYHTAGTTLRHGVLTQMIARKCSLCTATQDRESVPKMCIDNICSNTSGKLHEYLNCGSSTFVYMCRAIDADACRLKENNEKLRSILAEVEAFDEESEGEDDEYDYQEYQARSERINTIRAQMSGLDAALDRLRSEISSRER